MKLPETDKRKIISFVKPKTLIFTLWDVVSFSMCKCKRMTLNLKNGASFTCMYTLLRNKTGISTVDVRKACKKLPTTKTCRYCQTN